MDWYDVDIKLGDKCCDTVTGLKGVIVAKVEYLNGCRHFELQPSATKEGKVPPSQWPDVEQVKLVKTRAKPKTVTPQPTSGRGGPVSRPPAGISTPPSNRGWDD